MSFLDRIIYEEDRIDISASTVVLSVVAILALRYFARLIFVYYWPARHIPGCTQILPSFPFRIPYLAEYEYYGVDQGQWQRLFGKKTRGLVRVTMYGKTAVVVSHPDHLRQICITKWQQFNKPEWMGAGLEFFGPNIITIPGGNLWKKHRAMTDPCFSDQNMAYLAEVASQSFELMDKRIRAKHASEIASNGKFRWDDVKDDIALLALDIIGKAGFGTDLNVFAENNTFDRRKHRMSFVDALMTASGPAVALRFVQCFLSIPLFFRKYWPLKSVEEAIQETGLYVDELIEECREQCLTSVGDHGKDLMSLLVRNNIEAKNNGADASQLLSNQEIRSDVFTFLLAGHETSSTAIQWLLLEMALHQDIQDKLYAYINEMFPDGRVPTFDDFGKLDYVNAVIKECLRLHTPISLVTKEAVCDVEIEGFLVPKGTTIYLNFDNTHKDPSLWDDPLKFNPDRFLEKNADSINPLQFAPWALGPRRCSGSRFSMVEQVVLVCMLFRRYRVTLPEEWNNEPYKYIKQITFVTKFPSGLKVVLEPREK